jgi:hypothetical protein
MTTLRCRRAALGNDGVNATCARPGLCVSTLWVLLLNASVYAAGIGTYAGETGAVNDTVRRSSRPTAAASAKRSEFGQHGPIRSGDTASHDSRGWNSAARNGRQPTTLHAAGVLKSAVAAARGYLLRKPGAEIRPGSIGQEAAHAGGATNVSAPAGRQPSMLLSAASRPTAMLRATAVAGAIGGPRAAGPGSLGGPANGKAVINASIDGSALHRRF